MPSTKAWSNMRPRRFWWYSDDDRQHGQAKVGLGGGASFTEDGVCQHLIIRNRQDFVSALGSARGTHKKSDS
ncbi:hypothetical protein J7T55_010642 [Diaporthe amygdali]|uniref:uncharacterized protein n=1 Tax=Phomopsis amygdali TaxID=1214568 RepID=UPI0022FE2103|nr:uncharacterized protein J7T55_010642 [Diaporthe amygdali]KAJ0114255.1 hypothetical protein J7T55_010642 [Diaporthe amygdali]